MTSNLQLVDTPLPQSQEEVIERLLAEFDELPAQLQLCARYIIDHPHEVGLQSMRTLAGNAEVHPNSFVRLARHFGFDGYGCGFCQTGVPCESKIPGKQDVD